MKVSIIQTKSLPTHPHPGENTLIMQVTDDHLDPFTIYVFAYGSAPFTIQLANDGPDESWDPQALVDSAPTPFWGRILIWAEPLTIAHLIRDFLRNQ